MNHKVNRMLDKSKISILFLFISLALSAQEIVEFRGVGRSGVYHEKGLLQEWPEEGPALLLKIEGVGKGFSSPVVANETIFVTGIKEDTIDVLSAYTLNGDLLWDVQYGHSWIRTYPDSRSTPTYENGKIYVASGTGQLNCIDAKTGKIVWHVNPIEKYGGEIYKHGDTESPLLFENEVFYTVGGDECTLVALDKGNGKLIWKSKSLGGAKSYASPAMIKHYGKDLLVAQTSDNVIVIDPRNGETLWYYNLIQYHLNKSGVGAQTNPPIYSKGDLFVTSGYNHPGIKFRLAEDGRSAEVLWKNEDIDTHHGGVVLADGNLYGSNWQNNSNGRWASVNWETGKTNWDTEWFNKGSIIFADNRLYFYEEKRGNVALVEPNSNSLKIVSNFRVVDGAGPHWSHPAIFNGKLFLRHGDVLMVYDVKKE